MSEVYEYYAWPAEDLPATVTVAGVEAGRMTSDGPVRFLWQLDYFCLHVVISGHCTVSSDHGVWQLAPGDAFCLWPRQRIEYAQQSDERWEFCWVQFGGDGSEALARACGFTPARLVINPAFPLRAMQHIQALHTYFKQPAAARERYQALALLFEVVASFCHPTEPRESVDRLALLAQQATTAISSLLHTGLNVSELARHCGVSRATLLRAFQTHIGISPQHYIVQERLRAAQQLLTQTDASIVTIAATTGFANDKYFLQIFRRAMGVTPGEWRRRVRR